MVSPMSDGCTGDSEQLERVKEWDAHGNPYWNGVTVSGSNAPGTGKLHRARIEDGRVVQVECGANAETWVPFGASSTPQEERRTCSRCGPLARVPGVERDKFSWVKLTDDYNPERWSPKPLADGGRERWKCPNCGEVWGSKSASVRTISGLKCDICLVGSGREDSW